MNPNPAQPYIVLIATSLVSSVLGSIHAFSVFLMPLEVLFGTSRTMVSLTYSISLVCLTAMVLFGPSIYARMRPAMIYVLVATLGAVGIFVAGLANSMVLVWVGYGVLFGIANGLGYGFGLQFAARATPKSPGFAMGIVTAAYAFGAASAPYGFELALLSGGFQKAMLCLSIAIFAAGLVAALLIFLSQSSYASPHTKAITSDLPLSDIVLIWVSYGTAVFAGLMAIGHAAGLATAAGFIGWTAPAALACFNLLGSFLSGWLIDRVSPKKVLTFLPLISALSLAALAIFPASTLVLLCVIGFAYGGTIAAYPAAISQRFQGDDGPRVYGRVFTAWGTAGLLAPWVAGKIFDQTGGYGEALWIASALALVSSLLAVKAIGRG